MTESDYQINELAKKAGVSVRTIRFYNAEGLLPSPPSQGRYAVRLNLPHPLRPGM